MSSVEKIKFLDGSDLKEHSKELFLAVSSEYMNRDEHSETLAEIASKLGKIKRFYELPCEVLCDNGDPVISVALTEENLKTILGEEEVS